MTADEPSAPPTPGARLLRLGPVALWLLPERAAWWADERTLFVADLHLGRAPGDDPSPEAAAGAAREDLGRLERLLGRLGAARCLCLGDLRHARAPARAAADAVLAAWARGRPDPALLLVRGNQDEDAGDPPRAWGVETIPQARSLGALRLFHHPPEARAVDGPWIAGHLHPGVRSLPEGDLGAEVEPAFLREGSGLVLPAFGAGTRAHPPRRRPGQALWPIRAGRVEAATPVGPPRPTHRAARDARIGEGGQPGPATGR